MDKKTILAVDTESKDLTALKMILDDYFDVRLSKSSEAALELLRSSPVDLILLDLENRDMSGFDFLEYLYKTFPSYFKEIPVIIVSAQASYGSFQRAVALGVKDYILKPVKNGVLLKKIEGLIGLPNSDDRELVSVVLQRVLPKKAIRTLDMHDMEALFLDELDRNITYNPALQDPGTVDQLLKDLRYACSVHSVSAETLAEDLQEKLDPGLSNKFSELYKLIHNYEYQKALIQIAQFPKAM